MTTSRSTLTTGIGLAILATLAWSLNFIAPHVTGAYGLYDLLMVRFLFAGAAGLAAVILWRGRLRCLGRGQVALAAMLGVVGYLGYGSCIAAGVAFGGPVLTATLVGLVPVLLALLGNARERRVRWCSLAVPLGCVLFGLLCSTLSGPSAAQTGATAWGAGFSVLAVALWLLFSLLNQRAMDGLPSKLAGLWTGLMMGGAGVTTLCLIPLLQGVGLTRFPSADFGIVQAGHFYLWAAFIALASSVVGAWAWNAATQRLPMVLSGQLICLESLFAALLGLCFEGRWPTALELAGLLAVLVGAALAVGNLLRATDRRT
ncbi:DMT family transporter [Pseudomonas sp.]|uniref:DMT family transporter n=1 Tax=Pseudomonas sp. TaxID=306 RepID=UPI0028AFD6B0|nr:DMT family transporter [Pseudomonas sp.]